MSEGTHEKKPPNKMRRALTLFDNSVARCRGRRPLGAGVELLAAAQPAGGADAAPGDCGGLVDRPQSHCRSPIQVHYAVAMRATRAAASWWAMCTVAKSAGEGIKQKVRPIIAVGFDP